MLASYDTPKSDNIAVCLCYFSSAGYKRPRENFMRVKSMLDQAKIPTFTAECVIGNTPRLIPNPTLLVRSNSALFYKERLFNLLQGRVPSKYKKLIFMDCDIIFSDPKWVDKISNELNKYSVVQPFSKIVYTDASLNPTEVSNPSVIQRFKETRLTNGHPGFCWAFSRDYFKSIGGFFDKAIIGSGDTIFSNFLMKHTVLFTYKFINAEYFRWRLKANNIPMSVNYLNMTIYHLYHGDMTARNYSSRHQIPELHAIQSWDEAIYLNKDQMYELKDPKINTIFKEYFLMRKEDD